MSILKIKNADGTWSDIPAIKGVDGKDGSDGAPGKDGVIQYQAGDNIKIEGNVISAEVPDTGISMEDVTNITGFLGDLNTEDKTNLVNAINEILLNMGGNCKVKELTTTPVDLTTLEPGIYQNTTGSHVVVQVGNNVVTTISVYPGGQLLCFNTGTNYGCVTFNVDYYSDIGGLRMSVLWAGANKTPYRKHYYLKNMMDTSTAQTVTGLKTYNTLPQSSKVPSDNKDLTNKAYVDSAIAASSAGSGSTLEALVTADFSSGSFLNISSIIVDYPEEFADAVLRATENGTHYGIIIANTHLGMTYIRVNQTGSSNGNPVYGVTGVEYVMQADLEYSYLGYFSHQACIDSEGNLISMTESDSRSMTMDKILTMDNTTAYTPTSNYHPANKKYVDDSVNGLDVSGTVAQLGYIKEVSELNSKILENETTEVVQPDDEQLYWETTIVKPGYTSGGNLENLITLRDLYFALAPRNLATGKVRNSKFPYSSDADLKVLVAGNVINISGHISLYKGDLFDISWGSDPSNISQEDSPGLIDIYNPSEPFGGGNNFDVSGSTYFDELQGNWYDDLTAVLYTLRFDNFIAGAINLKAVSNTGAVIPLQLINCGDFVDADGSVKDYQKWKLIIPWEARNQNNSTNYFTQSGTTAYINETFVTKHFFGLGTDGNVLKMQTSLLTDAGEYNTVAWDGSVQS